MYFAEITVLLCFVVLESILVHNITRLSGSPSSTLISVCNKIRDLDGKHDWNTIAYIADRVAALMTILVFLLCSAWFGAKINSAP